jgi:hypothetical protein
MFQRDYLLRMIEQAAQALARALRKLAEKKPDEAAQQVGAGYAALGMDPEMLAVLDASSLRAQWSDPEQLAMAALLLLADAETHCLADDRALATRRFKAARKLHGLLDPAPADLTQALDRVAILLASA